MIYDGPQTRPPSSHRGRSFLKWGLCLLFLWGSAVSLSAADPPGKDVHIDFLKEVQPLLKEKCLRCHGPEKKNGGLRLDTRQFAASGGDTLKTVLGGDLKSNGLFLRVSSDNIADRMPKSSPPLTPSEIDVFRRWVLAGTPWPQEPSAQAIPQKAPPSDLFKTLDELISRYQDEYAIIYPFGVTAFLLLVGFAISDRLKRRIAAGKPAGRIVRLIAAPRHIHLAFLLVILFAAAWFAVDRHHDELTKKELSSLRIWVERSMAATRSQSSARGIYGFPPKSTRPDYPRQIEGTYYRGNCERSPQLFNNGNYRTATLRIGLCDARHQPLKYGDPIPKDGLFVRFEVDRAPRTTGILFTPEIIASIFLSSEPYEDQEQPLKKPVIHLEATKENQTWVAYYPIGLPQPGSGKDLAGTIYVYKGTVTEEKVRGEIHYGIQYDLTIENEKLGKDSDLWMASFYWNDRLAVPQPGKIPLEHWFDWRPIPEISGENSTDPTLLGIPEHLRKK
ncbi:MAG: c-type cytochrome domain-containing protein [Planctomycetales bacterium]